jgi:hypothetical protein
MENASQLFVDVLPRSHLTRHRQRGKRWSVGQSMAFVLGASILLWLQIIVLLMWALD